jgi:hypothetical protein
MLCPEEQDVPNIGYVTVMDFPRVESTRVYQGWSPGFANGHWKTVRTQGPVRCPVVRST